MNSTKVLQLLSELEAKDIKAFRKYIYSPYFNTHKETAIFFDLLYQADPSFKEKSIDPQKVFSNIYPSEDYCEGKMRILRKYLFKHLTNFLGQREISKKVL